MTHGEDPYHIRPRGGTAAEWTTKNPVLRRREIGVETDTLRAKLGDGSTHWNDLGYAFDEAGQVVAEKVRAEAAENALGGRLTAVEDGLAAELLDARNADNLESGTVPEARIPPEITRDSEVAALVAAELASYQPGLEIAYGERTTSATSTQTVPNAAGTISGLTSGVVTGVGRPVDVRFHCSAAWNSVANKHSFASLMVNGGAGGSANASHSPIATNGIGLPFTRRMVLTDGVDYTFTVALYTESGGGTVTAFASATYPMSISVTNR